MLYALCFMHYALCFMQYVLWFNDKNSYGLIAYLGLTQEELSWYQVQ